MSQIALTLLATAAASPRTPIHGATGSWDEYLEIGMLTAGLVVFAAMAITSRGEPDPDPDVPASPSQHNGNDHA